MSLSLRSSFWLLNLFEGHLVRSNTPKLTIIPFAPMPHDKRCALQSGEPHCLRGGGEGARGGVGGVLPAGRRCRVPIFRTSKTGDSRFQRSNISGFMQRHNNSSLRGLLNPCFGFDLSFLIFLDILFLTLLIVSKYSGYLYLRTSLRTKISGYETPRQENC